MMTAAIISTFIGALLGMRFKVFVLFPAMLFCAALSIGILTAQGSSHWNSWLAIVLSITGLQLGFFVNCVVPLIGRRQSQQLVQGMSETATVEAMAEQPDVELEAAFEQLDGTVAELIAVSTANQSAANARDEGRPPTLAAGPGR